MFGAMDETATPAIFEMVTEAGPRTLGLRGRIGPAEAVELRAACLPLAAAGQKVDIDCQQLEHMGGAGAQVMLSLQVQLTLAGASLSLLNVPAAVERTLSYAGISQLLLPGRS